MTAVGQQRGYENVLLEVDEEGIAWITLNRPDKRNAMSPSLHEEMTHALKSIEFDPTVRIVVLTGAGEAFSAGQDIELIFRDMDEKPAEFAKASQAARWRWQGLWTYPKPTIAMVNGFCFGGAFPVVIACDFALAAQDAQFGLSEVNWGIFPGGMVSRALPEALSYRDALYYSMTGDPFDGREAERIGLVNRAVPADRLREETLALGRKLLQKNPQVLKYTKIVYKNCKDMNFGQAEDYLAGQSLALKLSDPEKGRYKGMQQFLDDKSYRPGFEPYKRS